MYPAEFRDCTSSFLVVGLLDGLLEDFDEVLVVDVEGVLEVALGEAPLLPGLAHVLE